MKKRMLSILLTVCMALSLLPTTALASGNDTGMAMATNYEELVAALLDSTVTELTIYPQWPINIENNEYSYFTWPEGEVTLNLDAVNSVCKIYLGNGTWTIPENVTVNAYDTVYIGAPTGTDVVIDGTWNCMSNQAIIGNVSGGGALYGALTVNGTLAVDKDLRVSPAQVGSFTLNGTLENAGVCYINNMTMTNGAKVVNVPDPEIVNSMREIYLEDGGSITGPSTGSASIGGEITVSEAGTLSGNLTADEITLSSGSTLTVAVGADVTIGDLTCNGTSSSPAAINVNGKLTVTTDGYNAARYTTITLGENGVLALYPNVQFSSSSSNSTIEGDGTLELYGMLNEDDNCSQAPMVFSVSSDRIDYATGEYVTLTGVSDSVNVVRKWTQCQSHSWGEKTTVDATCGTIGYDIETCSICGTERQLNRVPPTGEHTITYKQNGTSAATATCSVCSWTGQVSISVPQSSYAATGEAITPAVLSKMGPLEESIPDAEITYKNNVNPGTATASATFGGVTISTTFNIVACEHVEGTAATCTSGPICSKCGLEYGTSLGHTGGTATCKEQATCTRCGEKYGNTGYHTYVLKSNAEMHWVECSTCGLEYLQDYGLDVTSPSQIPDEVLLEYICVYLEQQGGGTKDQFIYLEKYGDTPSKHACSGTDFAEGDVCLLCGYGTTACSHSWNDGEVTTAPTCTGKGVRTYTCSTCGETRTEDIPATGHTEVVDAAVAPTCTADGKTAGRHCSVCGTVLTAQETIDALGHDWGEGVITTPPTLDADGVKTFTCSRCGEARTEAVAKLEKQTIMIPGTSFEKTYGDDDFYNTASNLTADGGALTYSSSNTSVAKVDTQSGKVTVVGAGDAVITVTAAAVANQYAETSATYAVTVAKASLTITASDKTVTYGEKAANDGYVITGFVKGEGESVLSGEAVYSYTYKQYGDVDEYAISVSGLTAQNYDITFADGKLTVEKATEYTITLSDLEQLAGHVSGVTAQIGPYDTSAVLSVEYLVDGEWTTEAPQTAGTYQVRAALTASDNIVVPASAAYTTGTLTVKSGVTVDTGNGPENVDVAVEVSGGTAEINVSEENLDKIAENADGAVSIDLGSVSDVDTLVLPGALVEELSKSDKAESLTVSTENASVTLSASVLDTVANTVTGREDTVSVRLESVAKDELSQAQRDALDAITTEYPVAVVDVSLVVTHADGTTDTLHELGGDVTVTVPYEQLSGLLDGQYVVACYISDDGTVTYLFAQADETNRTITFTTNHFSNYAVFVSGKPTSSVTVDGGSGSGIYLAGDTVTVKADSKSGYTFAGWEVVSGGATLANATAAETTFPMPAANVALRATYTKNSSGGGGGGAISTYTLTFDTNGGSKIDSVYKTSGTTIDLSGYIPTRTGYDFGGWYSDAKLTDKVTSVKLTKDMTVYAKWTEKDDKNPFTDVSDDAYYADAVIWAVGEGITSGTTATTFSPNAPCTRAQAVTFLWRAAGSPAPKSSVNPFADVKADAYYYNAVAWAVEQGITKGTSDTTFSPNATCTRAQIVTFLWRSQKSPASDSVNSFTDVAADAYYTGAVLWAAENGITGGTTASTFSPDSDCTRAQIATFLFRSAK